MQHVPRDRAREKKMNNFDDISNSALSAMIDDWIKNQRDRDLLKRRLIDGVCFEPLAEEFDISVIQCKRIVYKCVQQIVKHM